MVTTAIRRPPSFPADPGLPGAAGLLADAGVRRVSGFLTGRGLEPQRVEPVQAHYRPGRWLAVSFRTLAVERSSGLPLTPTVTVECRAGEADALWAFPDDPVLPGLAPAADAAVVRRRLHPSPERVDVEPLRYRPRRRAVLRYRLDGHRTVFGKVVTPGRARRLLALAAALGGHGLTLGLPTGRIASGALLVPCVPGVSLRDLLLAGGPLPDPEQVAGLSAELHRRGHLALPLADPALRPAGPGGCRRRVDPATALGAAQIAARLRPADAGAAARVAEAVIASAEEDPEPPRDWIVHGDLYENQVLVDGEALGLIDLDDLGPGDPLLDAANFCAHLLLLGTSATPAGPRILAYRDGLRAAFCRLLDANPAALSWREAYCVLRLASGPFRVLHPDWPRRMTERLLLATEALSARR